MAVTMQNLTKAFTYFKSYLDELGIFELGKKINAIEQRLALQNLGQTAETITTLDLSGWDVSDITNMSYLFAACSNLESLDLGDWDLSGVTNMNYMFSNCSSLESLNFGKSVPTASMSGMFSNCSSLTSLDLSGWNIKQADSMFNGCSSLASLDLSGCSLSGTPKFVQTFKGCSSLASLDLSSLDLSSVVYLNKLFNGCSSLASLLWGGSISSDLDLSETALTTSSAVAFFNSIQTKTSENAVKIIMPHSSVGADISGMTTKGYTVEFSQE